MSSEKNVRRRTMNEKFSADQARLLVELVKADESLWNSNTNSYRNRDLKEIGWQNVAQKVGFDVYNVKTYWNNVRTRFIAERKKVIASQNEKVGYIYKSRFDLYESMLFLNDVCGKLPPANVSPPNLLIKVENPCTPEESLSPVPSFAMNSDVENSPVPKKRTQYSSPSPNVQRNAILNELSKFLKHQEPVRESWKTVFGEFIICELEMYDREDAIELKNQILGVCINFKPSQQKSN